MSYYYHKFKPNIPITLEIIKGNDPIRKTGPHGEYYIYKCQMTDDIEQQGHDGAGFAASQALHTLIQKAGIVDDIVTIELVDDGKKYFKLRYKGQELTLDNPGDGPVRGFGPAEKGLDGVNELMNQFALQNKSLAKRFDTIEALLNDIIARMGDTPTTAKQDEIPF